MVVVIINELWKDIINFEGYYQVSNHGRVRSLDRYVVANKNGGLKLLKGKIMKLTKAKGRNNDGYLVVNLRKKGKNKVLGVHRLVAEAFVDNPNNYPIPNHKDGNKENNFSDNLEWTTYSQNNQHAIDMKLRNPRGISVVQYDLDMNFIKEYKSASDAARVTKLGRGSICHCLSGRRNSYAGFIWKYKE